MASTATAIPGPRSRTIAPEQATKPLPTRANFLATSVTELICSICHLQLTDPVSLPCDHTFCRECITIWLTTPGRNTCPLDRSVLFALDDSDDPDLSLPLGRGDRDARSGVLTNEEAERFFSDVALVTSRVMYQSWRDESPTASETASSASSEHESLPSLETEDRDEDAYEFPEMAEDFFARPFVAGYDDDDDDAELLSSGDLPVARSAAVRTSRARGQTPARSSARRARGTPVTTTEANPRSAASGDPHARGQTVSSSTQRRSRGAPATTIQASSLSTPQTSAPSQPTRRRSLSPTDIHLLAVANHQLNHMGMRSIRDIPVYPHPFTTTDTSKDVRDCVDMIMELDASAVPVRLQTLKGFMSVIEAGARFASRVAMEAVLGEELECACEQHEEEAQMAFYTAVGILGERVVGWIRTFGEE